MYFFGGNTLIFSRSFERVDVHSLAVLKGGLHERFPDLKQENFDLVKVHHSVNMLDPVVNYAKLHYALVYIEENPLDVVVVLRLDLPPYEDIGAIFVPQVLKKSWLVMQTGIDLVCGPDGEVCACYHNGYELLSGEETVVYDGDYFVCWLDPECQATTGAIVVNVPLIPSVATSIHTVEEGCGALGTHGEGSRKTAGNSRHSEGVGVGMPHRFLSSDFTRCSEKGFNHRGIVSPLLCCGLPI